jgi:hypothetical protein
MDNDQSKGLLEDTQDIESRQERLFAEEPMTIKPYNRVLINDLVSDAGITKKGNSAGTLSTHFVTNAPSFDSQKYLLRAFMSTPNFVNDLTDICVNILTAEGDKMKYL